VGGRGLGKEIFVENIDYSLLKSNLKKIANGIFNNYVSKHGIKDICGFALYSDESAMSVSVAVNTYTHYRDIVKDDPENKLYYKFNPEEWNEIIEDDELNKFNEQLQKIALSLKKKQFAAYRDAVCKLSLEILDEMKVSEVFSELKSNFVLLFSVSDCDMPKTATEYNKRYNSAEIANEYEQWLKDESEYEDEDDD
jgi:hypothetical protein